VNYSMKRNANIILENDRDTICSTKYICIRRPKTRGKGHNVDDNQL